MFRLMNTTDGSVDPVKTPILILTGIAGHRGQGQGPGYDANG